MRELRRTIQALTGLQGEPLPVACARRLAAHPRCPWGNYLMGCHCLDRGCPALAVRHMMIAHHAEPDLESAALLVFAGLSWVGRRTTPLLAVLLQTWEEFRRPQFDRFPRERLLLDLLAQEPLPAGSLSPLARRLLRLPIPALRRQIRAALSSQEVCSYPLLLAHG